MKRGYNKILQLCLVFIMVFGLLTGGAAAETLSTVNNGVTSANFTDLGEAAWAQKNIIRLKMREIVSGYTNGTFRPNAQVTKAEVVVMAVRELGMEIQALQLANDTSLVLPNEFGEDIPFWAKGFVSVAWQQGLIKLEDNNFTWNAPADRAYVAQLAIRLIGKEQEALFITNPASGFTDDADIPSWARGYVAMAVNEEILVGYGDGTFQPARAVTRAEIATILARCEDKMALSNVIHGVIEDVNTDDFIIADKDDNLFRLNLAAGAWIFEGNTIVGAERIMEGDTVTLIKINTKTAVFIDLLSSGGNIDDSTYSSVEGEVVSIDTDDEEIRIKDEDGDRTTYSVDDNADIILDGDDGYDLDDVKVGDSVELTIEDEVVTSIEVVESNTVEGEVLRISSDDEEIRIEDADGDRTTYSVDDDADIIIDGDDGYDLDDVKVGDQVALRIEDGDVISIDVIDDNRVEGEVVRISSDDEEIRIEDADGDRTTYGVKDGADVIIDGDDGYDLDDIEVGMEVKVRVDGEDVTEIEVIGDTVALGEVVSVDASDEEIRIEDEDGERTTYSVDDDADIIVNDDDGYDLDDIDEDDQVKLVIDDDIVVKIWVIN